MSKSEFANIKTEGALLSADLLRSIAAGETKKVKYLSPADYHLSGERLNEAVTRAWMRAREHWARFKQKRNSVASDDVGTTVTRTDWLLQLFKILEYGQLHLLKTSYQIEGKTYPVSHAAQEQVAIHLVGFRQDLDHRNKELKGGAPRSPHSMVQEFLNREEKFTWAFLSNGLKFRILRDNVSMVRMAYVEFDLEAIFDHESFSEFYVFYLLVHQSRLELREEKFEESPEKATSGEDTEEVAATADAELLSRSCILERWYKTSIDDGIRILDDLRNGVTRAIKELGSGFLAQPKNHVLREKLRSGEFAKAEFYHELLRIVYRLLFLFVAEDRNLLFPADVPQEKKAIYYDHYSLSRLRELARKRRGSRHTDLWYVVKRLFTWIGCGSPELQLPAIGSDLFSDGFIPTLTRYELNNTALLTAIRHLTFTTKNSTLQQIDYRNMGTEELGSVYESLLEMHPEIDPSAHYFELRAVAGNDRKTTGSYYTPPTLVNSLLDTALEPVIQHVMAAAHTTDEREAALLGLKICDPACGSGHFLIGAAHRLARRLATVRSDEDEPSAAVVQHAIRDVAAHCLYGVDINPMAVELCKISLWMDAMDPGRPLAFLDHHIQCGNSLLGATPAMLKTGIPDEAFTPIEGDDKKYAATFKKQNKGYRSDIKKGQSAIPLADSGLLEDEQQKITARMQKISSLEDESYKESCYNEWLDSDGYRNRRLYLDSWCAAFVWKKCDQKAEGIEHPITEHDFRMIERDPTSCPEWMRDEICRLAEQYRFFHWHLAFPEVFTMDEDSPQGWSGGFDAVLGNPPWERVKLQEKEWFAKRNPAIANAANASKRKALITGLKEKDAPLLEAFREDARKAEGTSQFIRLSGRYPLCGRGDVNTYTIFAELNRQLLSSIGRVGCIVPSGIATDDTTKLFFQDLIEKQTLVSLFDFENRKKLFPEVDSRMKFSLLTMCSPGLPAQDGAELAFFAYDTADLEEDDKVFRLTPAEIAMINPNTRTCPIFRSVKDAELTKAIYRRVPVLIREARDGQEEVNPWGISFSRMFDMSNDSNLFRTKDELQQLGYVLEGNHFVGKLGRYLPLYEAKMMHQFNHRFGDYADLPEGSKSTQLPEVPVERLNNPEYMPLPRYWVPEKNVMEKIPEGTKFLMGWRDITNVTNERTSISSILPVTAVGHTLPLYYTTSTCNELCGLLTNFSSFIFDYAARQKVGGTHLTYLYLKQFPTLTPGIFDHLIKNDFILSRVRELVYTSQNLASFENSCNFSGPPFRWDESRRFLLRCELDALFFGLYLGFGDWSQATEYEETPAQRAELAKYFPTPRDAIDYIMDTFPIVRRKDEARHGSYRTKETILDIYDAMTLAIHTGTEYQTRLSPPPADDSMRHGSESSLEEQQVQLYIDTQLWVSLLLLEMDAPVSKRWMVTAVGLMLNDNLRGHYLNKYGIKSGKISEPRLVSEKQRLPNIDIILGNLKISQYIDLYEQDEEWMIRRAPAMKTISSFMLEGEKENMQKVRETIEIMQRMNQEQGHEDVMPNREGVIE